MVGLIGFFPIGLDTHDQAMERGYATDLAENFLRFAKAEAEKDLEFLNLFRNDRDFQADLVNGSEVWTNESGELAAPVFQSPGVTMIPAAGINISSNGQFRHVSRAADCR